MIEQHLLTDLGVRAAVAAIGRGETTSADLVEACLRRIASTDDELKAWVTVDADGARAAARLRDDDVRAGRRLGPLHGVPLGIKDIVDVTGMPTTAGAGPFAHRHPRDDAPLVGRERPSPESEGGWGLWIVNSLCDLVQLRTFDNGSVARLHMRLA